MTRHVLPALACALLVAGAGCRDESESGAPEVQPEPSARAEAGIVPSLGTQLPLAARFRASDGRDLALGDVLGNGRPALLVLAYNRCTMLCSLVLRSVAGLVSGLQLRAGEQFSLVTISIDPTDTVHESSRMQTALLDAAGMPGQTHAWEFLVGARGEIDSVARAVGFRYAWDPATQQYAHPAVVFAIGTDGKLAGVFEGLNPDRSAIQAALTRRGVAPAAASVQDVVLDCFRFDGAQRRYGLAIAWLLRAGATAVVLGLLMLLWRVARDQRPPARGQS